MNDLIIKVSKRSRLIDLDHSTLGIVGENLQEKLIFIFQDEFVDGMARLEYELDGEKHYVLMEKVGQSYILPVQNVLLSKEGNIDLQLVVTQDETGTPVFKSEVFTLYCKKSIEAVGEAPSSYELWIETANRILAEASRVNIDGKKTGNETIITITQRDGNKKSFPVLDGKDGAVGPQGPMGPQGPEGPEGPQGPEGPTPDLSNYVQKPEFNASQATQDERTNELQAELDRYKLLENALPHTENETPSDYVTLENTAKSPMEIDPIPQTSQETTTGAQLYNYESFTTKDIEYTIDSGGFITASYSNNTDSIQYLRFYTSPLDLQGNSDYNIFAEIKECNGNGRLSVVSTGTGAQFSSSFARDISTLTDNSIINSINKTIEDPSVGSSGLRTIIVVSPNQSGSITFRVSVLEDTTITPSTFVYQKYTGGIPAPNPDFPMDIHCTTGENQVKVTNSDSTEEKNYPISLGDKEMYNTNIIADGFVYDETTDKFYIERKIGKVVFDGSESWTYNISNEVYILNLGPIFPQRTTIAPFSNYFIGQTSSTFDQVLDKHISLQSTATIDSQRFLLKFLDVGSTVGDLQQWLSTHNTIVVYQLETSTLEEITDTTLISQLRAIKDALSMQGTTHIISTSSGTNLPFLIKARAVQTIERT